MENTLVALSNELAGAVERAGHAVVAVNARSRVGSSGIAWRPGVVVAAQHTIRRDEDIAVMAADGRRLAATLAGRDPATDLAVLRCEDAAETVPNLAAPEELRAGNLILAVGRGWESGVNATLGVISAVHGPWRTWHGGLIDRFVRLDVSLYPGSSGSAVVNARGEVLGMATSGLTRFAGVCIPAATVNRVVDALLNKGHVSRGYLGVGLQPVRLPERLAEKLKTERTGLIIVSVEPDGPADRGGILIGDVLVGLDGKTVKDPDDVQAALDGQAVGRTVRARVIRGGALAELDVVVGERPHRRC